jgi:PIN domain nuclease of toxin-antitoxin system
VNLLLDTHVLLWWLGEPERLKPAAQLAIGDPTNQVYVSAIVIWEIIIKRAIGKLEVRDDLDAALEAAQFQYLSITVDHARAVAELPNIHRDPFDRMLIAQARSEGFHLVTQDGYIVQYPVDVILA